MRWAAKDNVLCIVALAIAMIAMASSSQLIAIIVIVTSIPIIAWTVIAMILTTIIMMPASWIPSCCRSS